MGKRRVLSEKDLKELVLPGKGQLLGIVKQLLGFDRVRVKCADGYERLCRIRGKLKRKIWVKEGDVVLVEPWDFQYIARGDILWRYSTISLENLSKFGFKQDLVKLGVLRGGLSKNSANIKSY